MDPLLRSFQDAVIVRNVVARTKAATKFPTEEARKKYLQKHPKADPRKHTVKKQEGGGASEPESKEPVKKENSPDHDHGSESQQFKPTSYHKDLGGMMSQWHGPGSPAISEVASHLIAGKPFKKERLLDAAKELEGFLPDAKAGKHGWGKSEVRELNKMISHLKNLHTPQKY